MYYRLLTLLIFSRTLRSTTRYFGVLRTTSRDRARFPLSSAWPLVEEGPRAFSAVYQHDSRRRGPHAGHPQRGLSSFGESSHVALWKYFLGDHVLPTSDLVTPVTCTQEDLETQAWTRRDCLPKDVCVVKHGASARVDDGGRSGSRAISFAALVGGHFCRSHHLESGTREVRLSCQEG